MSAAQRLAQAAYQEPKGQVPETLLKISYDQWRDIRFRPELSLWRRQGLPFEAQFFHPGCYFDRTVRINAVDSDGPHPVAFSPSLFDYGKNKFAGQVPTDLGFAGLRLHYPINRPDYKDEVIVFLGASYFRALGRDQVFGLSARGLAVDTGLATGEEFPSFKEFWLVTPSTGARSVELYALLDSRRVAGAYRFVVTPGTETLVDVEARLYPRERIERLGLAPLTSMYFYGKNSLVRPVDYRPEVHDSDGLLLASEGGEWLWRPLLNSKLLNISTLQAAQPKGFGLLQRERRFAQYQDLESRFELRPSAWVEPHGRWGEGAVMLVEIPSEKEIHDNVVAFWLPREPASPGEVLVSSYTLHWYADAPDRPPAGRVEATRRDFGTLAHAHRFVIDFSGRRLSELPADSALRGVVTVGSGAGQEGELLEQQLVKNPATGGWRLVFQVRPKTDKPLELRAYLAKDQEVLTETWSSVVLPEALP